MDMAVIVTLAIAHMLILAVMAYMIVDILSRNKKLKEKNLILDKECATLREELQLSSVAERKLRSDYAVEMLRKDMTIHALEASSTELAKRILLMQCTLKKTYVPIIKHGLSSWELLSRFSELSD